MRQPADSFDFILNTVSSHHDINACINQLRPAWMIGWGIRPIRVIGEQIFSFICE